MLSLASLLVVAAVVTPQGPTVTLTDAPYPANADGLWRHGENRVAVARVIDGLTGAPLPGAELWSIPERDTPIRGEFWGERLAVADAEGFVRIAAPRNGLGWLMLRAAGYGATTSPNVPASPVVPLAPAQTLPVRVLDWRHQPVAGALVGWCGGCGHCPDLAHGRTDAEGLARLAGLDPHNEPGDLYVEHPGLGIGYDQVDWWPGQAPARLVVPAAASAIGALLDAAGQPIEGAYVGVPTVHRGPWTRTRADGSFALHGVELPADLHVHHGKRKVIFAGGLLPTLRMPADDGEPTQVVNEPQVDAGEPLRALLRIRDAEGRPVPEARYRLVGPLPARRERRGRGSDDDAATEYLPAGRYELFAASAQHKEARRELEVNKDGEEFALRLEALPTVRVALDARGEAVEVALRTEHGDFDCTDLVRDGAPIGLPEAPFCFVLRVGARERVFAYEQAGALAEAPVTLRWFAPTRVRGKVVDQLGQPTTARVSLRRLGDGQASHQFEAQGAFELPVRAEGLWFATAEGKAGARCVAVLLPELGDDQQLDLGALALGAPAQLTALDPTGAPLRGELTLLRAGWHDLREAGPSFPLDAAGRWLGPELRAGDAVLLPMVAPAEVRAGATCALPVRLTLRETAPTTLRVPAGELRVRVTSGEGSKLAFGLTCAETFVAGDGELTLQRVPAGQQRLWIGADDHRSAVVDVMVPNTGRAEVQVVLPRSAK